jgi:hypothetical protein
MLAWMGDVHVGPGNLGGRGIYASRPFEQGEVVVSYELRRLTREEYLALPVDERLFVHSYGGERWLYPAPARYANHDDRPNTRQDFDRGCDVAVRRIEVGELITLDAREETDRELETFLAAYGRAVDDRDRRRLGALIDPGATGWVGGSGRVDRDGIIDAAVGHRFEVRDPTWIIATGRWEAVCSYDGGAGPVTDVLKVVDGNWQLVLRHASPAFTPRS